MTNVAQIFDAATRAHRSGDVSTCERLYRELLTEAPEHSDALHLLGLIVSGRGDHAEAVQLIGKAVALEPGNAIFVQNFGQVHQHLGSLDRAMGCHDRALSLKPAFPEAHFNRGNVLKLLNRHEEAIDAYGTAIRLRPGYAKAMFNLGNALNETGRTQSAVDAYRAALALKPDWPDALMNLGNALTDLDQSEQALATYHRAAELDPARRELQASLAGVYSSMGHITLARKHFAAASAGRESLVSRLRQATLAAPIPPDEGAIEQFRASLSTAINRLAEECAGQKVDVASLHKSGAEPPMLLAYDARENREIRSAYAGLFRGLLNSDPPLPLTSAPHIGFVVTRGHEGVFFKCMGGIVNRWPANAPRLSLVCTRSGRNILSQWVHNPKVGFIVLPERLPDAAEAIREAGVHLLHYWEVGTDSTNYFLPMLRPAPVQTATWGWPVTTGLPDCFSAYVSSQKLEPVDGAQHYAEQLVMLPSLPTCYARPPAPARRAPKSDFGLSTGQRLYVCPQNLRKILPSFDAVLTELLRQDASGVLMFIADAQPSITTMFRSRIDAAAGDVADRVRIAPRMPEQDYLQLLSAADVWLDPPGYGGGANTVYDAVAANLPMVTRPGEYHRGRWCQAVCHILGVSCGIAASMQEYIACAIQLATDSDLNESIRHTMQLGSPQLFDDQNAVNELAASLSALAAANDGNAT